jgi:hypothetical protein
LTETSFKHSLKKRFKLLFLIKMHGGKNMNKIWLFAAIVAIVAVVAFAGIGMVKANTGTTVEKTTVSCGCGADCACGCQGKCTAESNCGCLSTGGKCSASSGGSCGCSKIGA